MNPILQALSSGYDADSILSFLAKAYPSIGGKIRTAANAGYSSAKILNFLSASMGGKSFDTQSSQYAEQKKYNQKLKNTTDQLLKNAAGLVGAGIASRAIPAAISTIFPKQPPSIPNFGRTPPPVPTSPPPTTGPQPMGGAPLQPAPVTPTNGPPPPAAPQLQVAGSPTAPTLPATPSAPPHVNKTSLIDQLGVAAQIKNLAQAGNSPTEIAHAVRATLKPHQKKWLENEPGDFEQEVASLVQATPEVTKNKPEFPSPRGETSALNDKTFTPSYPLNQEPNSGEGVEKIDHKKPLTPKEEELNFLNESIANLQKVKGIGTPRFQKSVDDRLAQLEEFKKTGYKRADDFGEEDVATTPRKEEEIKIEPPKTQFKEAEAFTQFMKPYRAAMQGVAETLGHYKSRKSGEKVKISQHENPNEAWVEYEDGTRVPITKKAIETYYEKTQDSTNKEPTKNQPKIEKEMVVALPNGEVGEVKDTRNGKALVQTSSGQHVIEAKEAILPDEDIIESINQILKLSPEERSAPITSVLFRPSKNEMIVKFNRTGTSTAYMDVDRETMEAIAEGMGTPLTSGKNIYGEWTEGEEKSRGAAFHKLIRSNPKYGADQKNITWENLETPYDRLKKYHTPTKKKKLG